MDRKPISSTLRGMPIGSSVDFPIGQKRSLSQVIYVNLAEERSNGMNWSVKTNIDEKKVTVTRTA